MQVQPALVIANQGQDRIGIKRLNGVIVAIRSRPAYHTIQFGIDLEIGITMKPDKEPAG